MILIKTICHAEWTFFLEPRPKLRWATNIDPKPKMNYPKKRVLEYDDDDEEQVENTPLLKRISPSPHTITSNQPSVIDDEELDFL